MSFFTCRSCTGDLGIFGLGSSTSAKKPKPGFDRRPKAALLDTLSQWAGFVHPRALELFPNEDAIRKVLREILMQIDKTSDPVLGEEGCVTWHGDVTREKGTKKSNGVIRLSQPGFGNQTVTYVNRVLPFLFADDESFDELMALPKEAFHMSCGNSLCCSMAHISFKGKPAGSGERGVSGNAEDAGKMSE